MPTYELTSPDGQKYRVTAPEGASEQQVMAYFRNQMAASQAQPQLPAEQPAQKPDTSLWSPFMQGPTLGFSEELGALGAWIGSGLAGAPPERRREAAQQELERQRAQLAATREESPWLSTGLELGGALVPGVGAARLATSVPRLLGLGVGEGALAGAGAAEGGMPERALGAGLGGAAGGIFAGAIPAAGYLTQRGIGAGQDIYRRMTEQPTTRAGGMLADWMQSGGMTPTKLQARARQLGPQATIAEAGGPAGIAMGQGVIGEPTGQARIMAEREFGKRLPGMSERVRGAVAEAAGVKQRLMPVLDEINARQKAVSKPAYDLAYSVDIKPDDDLINIMNRPSVKKALPLALRGAADEGRALPQLEKITMAGDDVTIGRENFPDMEALDHVKRSLDDMVSAAYRRGDPEARAIKNARDALKEKLDTLNPDYKTARTLYAGDAALKDAMEEGEKFLTRKTREVHEYVRGLGEGQREAFLTGAVEAMREKIGRARSGEMSGFRFLEQEGAFEKLRSMFPKGRQGDRALAGLKRQLMRERTLKEAQSALLGGSQTALRQQAAEAVGGGAALPTGSELMDRPLRSGIEKLVTRFTRALERERQPTIDALANMLFKPGQINIVIEEMQRRGIPDEQIARFVNRFSKGSAALAPAAGLAAGEIVE